MPFSTEEIQRISANRLAVNNRVYTDSNGNRYKGNLEGRLILQTTSSSNITSNNGQVTLDDTIDSKQEVLVSSDNLKTVNGNSLLGSGNLIISTSGGNSLSTTVTVTENIAAYEVVNSDGSKADSSIVSKRDKAIGVANQAILSGFSGEIITSGIVLNELWSWTKGDIIFLNGTGLSITAPTSGFIQKIGTAIGSIEIDLQIDNSIRI